MAEARLHRPESLESRLALAGVFSFFDVDGDVVTVRSSRGTTADLAAALSLNPAGLGSQLTRVNLSTPVFAGTRLRISAEDSGAGDRMVNVGEILAPVDLEAVEVDGDLAKITAGDAVISTRGLGRLAARSIGAFGTRSGAPDTASRIEGGLGAARVDGDMLAASLSVVGRVGRFEVSGDVTGGVLTAFLVDSVTIGGSLTGGSAGSSGRIFSLSRIRQIQIGGGLVGGDGEWSGSVSTMDRIGDIRIGGSVVGGGGVSSGTISAGRAGIGRVVIGGSIFGGSRDTSGAVRSDGGIGSVSIGGSVFGAGGPYSGRIEAAGRIDSLRVVGDLAGGPEMHSGSVAAGGRIGRLDVGSIFASAGFFSGSVTAGQLGTVRVRREIAGLAGQQAVVAAVGLAGPAIESLSVTGTISNALVLAGYDTAVPVNGNARIGRITVGGGLVATSIVAGVENLVTPGYFGNPGDALIAGGTRSRIESVAVGGSAVGSANPAESFAVTAGSVGRIHIGGARYRFTPGVISSPRGDNFAIHDI